MDSFKLILLILLIDKFLLIKLNNILEYQNIRNVLKLFQYLKIKDIILYLLKKLKILFLIFFF